jgi:RNA polymerase sigma-70 factor (ECF subfamily)
MADAFRAHRRLLWGIVYRMTGSSADADDVVQETFARAVERPPVDATAPLRPWLTCVAMNLARDALRARKRRSYCGHWLPGAVDSDQLELTDIPADAAGPEARYDLAESASLAFLAALEALTARQRAVLLLRDVLDYSVTETAAALSLTENNVKTTHHRARQAMRVYDERRRPLTPALQQETRAVLERFVMALLSGDVGAAESLVAPDARALSDGGGEFTNALRPVLGRERVVRFLMGLSRKAGAHGAVEVRGVNGLPALVFERDEAPARFARRFVMRCDLDPDGTIREVHLISATRKLAGVAALAEGALRV